MPLFRSNTIKLHGKMDFANASARFFSPEGKKRFMTETTAGAEKVLPVHGGRIDFAA
jgi:hypothetical protein